MALADENALMEYVFNVLVIAGEILIALTALGFVVFIAGSIIGLWLDRKF